MLPKDLYLEFHSLFYDLLVNPPPSTVLSQAEHLPYDSYELPSEETRDTEWWVFQLMAKDFIRDLKNEMNGFLSDINRLEAWSEVYEQCPKETKFDLLVELLDSIGRSLLHRPYIIQQRFIYVASMLLHQTDMVLDTDSDLTPLNERYVGKTSFQSSFENRDNPQTSRDFMNAILEIGGPDFTEITGNFRNLDTHRIPPKIEIGLSQYVKVREVTRKGRRNEEKREVDKSAWMTVTKTKTIKTGENKTISYDLCTRQPLKIKALLPLLYEQHQLCHKSFYSFWTWLTELVELWKSERPAETPDA